MKSIGGIVNYQSIKSFLTRLAQDQTSVRSMSTTLPLPLAPLPRVHPENDHAARVLETFFQLPHVLICVIDLNTGHFLRLNSSWETALGFTMEEFLARPWIDFIHPQDRAAVCQEIKKNLQGNRTANFQSRYLCKDNSFKWFAWNADPVGDFLYCIAHDITGLKETESGLLSEIQFRQQVQSVTASLALGLSAKEVSEILLTRGLDLMGGQSGLVVESLPDEGRIEFIAGKNYPEAMVKLWQNYPENFRLPLFHVLETGEPLFINSKKDLLTQFPDARKVVDQYSIQAFIALPLKIHNRVIAGVGFSFATAQEFEEKQKEFLFSIVSQCAQAIDRAFLYDRERLYRERLQDAVNARDEFLSIVSHELKTPLTSIKLQTEIAKRNLETRTEQEALSPVKMKQLIDQTDRSVARLSGLVDDMLDISRIATGRLALRPESFDLVETVREILSRFFSMLSRANCPVSLTADEEVIGVWDRFRIEQVITNLLTNAARYGSGQPIEITVRSKGQNAELRIKDFGRGIAAADQERIFQRFERAISVTEISGMGLGLYIVQQILGMHQGSIRVKSSLGQGAEFIVSLPIQSPLSQSARAV